MIGRTLSHFTITARLGVGGMGEVYRATDSKLGREVAIKVLPEAVSAEPERLARLDREARVLASLNHPSIAAIHSFEHEGPVHFLVMELVEGEDLVERIARGPLSSEEALTIALQIAEALEAAHERGIIHRDLKPANIRVASEGRVKVLDFGLAKAFEPGEAPGADDTASVRTLTAGMTGAGSLLGTAAYMSPEQARGQVADKRADIWSFGVVLYEMLTGSRLFDGESMTDVLAAVVRDDLGLEGVPADVPLPIRDLLERCLERDSKERLRDIGEARVRIRRALDAPETPRHEGATPPPRRAGGRRSRWASFLMATLILFAGITVGVITKSRLAPREQTSLLSGASITRITDFEGSERSAAISRDGKVVAFLSDRGGQFDIWVKPVGAGQAYNLTNGVVRGLNTQLRAVAFTHDGLEVCLGGSMNGRMRRMPLLGGAPRHWLGPQAINISWSPEGDRIVYTTSEPGDPLIVADSDGSNRREILNAGTGFHQHYPTWAADGWIYLIRGQENTLEEDLWRIRPDGTGGERLVTGTRGPIYPTPIDEKTVLFVAQEVNGAGPWLWAFDLESRRVQRLTFGLEQYTSIAASEDGRRLVASVANPRVRLWQVPIMEEVASEPDVGPFELPTVRALAPRFGPDDLYYLSSLGTGDGLWRYRDGTSSEIWKGADNPLLQPVAVSADGASLALAIRQENRNVLHVLTADGAELRALSSSVNVRGSASWSPDGAWLVVGGDDLDGRPGLFRISADGESVEKIVDGQALNPVWSPRAELIVYEGPQVNAVAPILGVRPDGAPVELPPLEVLVSGQRVRFLPNGKGLVHMRTSIDFRQDFWLLDLETLQDRRLTRMEDPGVITGFDVTPDGKRIVFDRLNQNSDIVLIELASRE